MPGAVQHAHILETATEHGNAGDHADVVPEARSARHSAERQSYVPAGQVVEPEKDGGAGREAAPGGAGGQREDAGEEQRHRRDGTARNAQPQREVDERRAHARCHETLRHAVGEHQHEEYHGDAAGRRQAVGKGPVEAAVLGKHIDANGGKGGDRRGQEQIHAEIDDHARENHQREEFQESGFFHRQLRRVRFSLRTLCGFRSILSHPNFLCKMGKKPGFCCDCD